MIDCFTNYNDNEKEFETWMSFLSTEISLPQEIILKDFVHYLIQL